MSDYEIKKRVIETAKEKHGVELHIDDEYDLWSFVKNHMKSYAPMFGEIPLREQVKDFTLPVKRYCPSCELALLELGNFLEFRQGYDHKVTVTFHQDWLGGNLWHLHKVEYGKYEPFKNEEK